MFGSVSYADIKKREEECIRKEEAMKTERAEIQERLRKLELENEQAQKKLRSRQVSLLRGK